MKSIHAAIAVLLAFGPASAEACGIRPEDVKPDRRTVPVMFEQASAVVLARLELRSIDDGSSDNASSVTERYAVIERFKGSVPGRIATSYVVPAGCGFELPFAPAGGEYVLFLDQSADSTTFNASKVEGLLGDGSERAQRYLSEMAILAAKENKLRTIK